MQQKYDWYAFSHELCEQSLKNSGTPHCLPQLVTMAIDMRMTQEEFLRAVRIVQCINVTAKARAEGLRGAELYLFVRYFVGKTS
ncbi:hypothetical protein G3F99_001650 [Salmonella enterica subsp. enterica]|nr:hypothetical protein [Salmonella enterica subsp. enterica serovar Poona]EEH7483771.1 hypothetical protein [Salmonella enterica subsp. enterica]EGI5655948.1 hypothetical protein [Salmonella enterica subsp. enterica serovar Kisarawe]EHT7091781.1 hypothetical protein [Salmonella enterica]EDP9160204.1 hypothetical protein [Salmonella enterica subsp. enterica serovar Poona]